MNRDRIQGLCKQLGGRLQERWGTLIGDRLTATAGARARLAGRIQERRGISKQEADRQLEDFLERNRNWRDLSKRAESKSRAREASRSTQSALKPPSVRLVRRDAGRE